MKFSKLPFVAIVALFAVFASCQKEPSADFTTDKTAYTGGETVKLTNKTVDGHSYKWTLPDGQTSTAENVDYVLDPSASGTQSFKLEAFSKNGKKSDETVKTVTATPANGKVVFWQSPACGCGYTDVVINNQTEQISMDLNSSPECGASGAATFTLAPGTYNYAATDGNYTWSGTVTIQAGGCLAMELQ